MAVILALLPSDPGAAAVEGGDPPEELHLTLLYIRSEPALDQAEIENVLALIESAVVPRETGEIIADVVGAGMLGEDAAIIVDCEGGGLRELQHDLLETLEGVAEPPKFPAFRPHMTLGYAIDTEQGEALVIEALSRVGGTQAFDRIALMNGGTDPETGEKFKQVIERSLIPAPVEAVEIEEIVAEGFAQARAQQIEQFANPWHDESGKFAPKGTGSTGGGSASTPAVGDWVETATGQKGRVAEIHESNPNTKAWLDQQEVPITDEQLNEPWVNILVDGGGSVSQPASNVTSLDGQTGELKGHWPKDGFPWDKPGAADAAPTPKAESGWAKGENGEMKLYDQGADPASDKPAFVARELPDGSGKYVGYEIIDDGSEHGQWAPATNEHDTIDGAVDEVSAIMGVDPPEKTSDEDFAAKKGLKLKASTTMRLRAASRREQLTARVAQFANPWHDEAGKFAPKGAGKTSGDLRAALDVTVDPAMKIMEATGLDADLGFMPHVSGDTAGLEVSSRVRLGGDEFDVQSAVLYGPDGEIERNVVEVHPVALSSWTPGAPVAPRMERDLQKVADALHEITVLQAETVGAPIPEKPEMQIMEPTADEGGDEDWTAKKGLKMKNSTIMRLRAASQRERATALANRTPAQKIRDMATARRAALAAKPGAEFANPWHDEQGKFAPKGTVSAGERMDLRAGPLQNVNGIVESLRTATEETGDETWADYADSIEQATRDADDSLIGGRADEVFEALEGVGSVVDEVYSNFDEDAFGESFGEDLERSLQELREWHDSIGSNYSDGRDGGDDPEEEGGEEYWTTNPWRNEAGGQQFANPYHDEQGKFAPKGLGKAIGNVSESLMAETNGGGNNYRPAVKLLDKAKRAAEKEDAAGAEAALAEAVEKIRKTPDQKGIRTTEDLHKAAQEWLGADTETDEAEELEDQPTLFAGKPQFGLVGTRAAQFANPWHDDMGRFAPKGVSGGGREIVGQDGTVLHYDAELNSGRPLDASLDTPNQQVGYVDESGEQQYFPAKDVQQAVEELDGGEVDPTLDIVEEPEALDLPADDLPDAAASAGKDAARQALQDAQDGLRDARKSGDPAAEAAAEEVVAAAEEALDAELDDEEFVAAPTFRIIPSHAREGEMATPPATPNAKPPVLLLGMKVVNPDAIPHEGPGLPYMGNVPYVALGELKLRKSDTLDAVVSALDGVEIPAMTSKVTSALSASNPLRRAILMDPEGALPAYTAMKEAIEAGGLKWGDYPFAVQLGAGLSKEDVVALKGSDLEFSEPVIMMEDGSTIVAEKLEAATEVVEEEVDEAEVVTPDGEVVEDEEKEKVAVVASAGVTARVVPALVAAGAAVLDEEEVEVETDPAIVLEEVVDEEEELATEVRWEGLLAVEGVASGDGRQIEDGALTWRTLPLPLMMMTKNPVGGDGHDGADLAGRIDWIERRDGGQVWGGGVIDLGSEVGMETARLLTPNKEGKSFLRGVSVDLDEVELAMSETDGDIEAMMNGTAKLRVGRGRVMGATLTPFPAFQEAQVVLVSDALAAALSGDMECDCELEEALVASAGQALEGAHVRIFTPLPYGGPSLVASAGEIPVDPPSAYFALPDIIPEGPVRIDGAHIFGLAASKGSCHIGFSGKCVPVPTSRNGYRSYCNKETLTAEGTLIATGPIVMDTVHPDLKLRASDAQAFYAHTGCAVADVAAYDTPKGIYITGALRPTITPTQLRALRGSDISPDWRSVDGRLECVAMLAVNTSGFITPALVASGGEEIDLTDAVAPGVLSARVSMSDGQVMSLVAAGMVMHSPLDELRTEFAALRAEFVGMRAELDERLNAELTARQDVAKERFHMARTARNEQRFAAARKRFATPDPK